jgi:hypothetical protein
MRTLELTTRVDEAQSSEERSCHGARVAQQWRTHALCGSEVREKGQGEREGVERDGEGALVLLYFDSRA